MSAETDFWIPATQSALANWDIEWRKVPFGSPTAGSQNSVRKIDAACDLESVLLDAVVQGVVKLAAGCLLPSDLPNPSGVADTALEPISRRRRETVAGIADAYQRNSGNGTMLASVVSDRNRKSDAVYKAAVGRLRVELEQRKRHLESSEHDKSQRRDERAEDVADRRKKFYIDLAARVVQLGAASFALFESKAALVFSLVIGIAATGWHYFDQKDDF